MKIDDIINTINCTSESCVYYQDHKRCPYTEAARILRECVAAGFVTEEGEVRKVNGKLCFDADGVIVSHGGKIYPAAHLQLGDDADGTLVSIKFYVHDSESGLDLIEDDELEIAKCYSTPEAAAAAKGKS